MARFCALALLLLAPPTAGGGGSCEADEPQNRAVPLSTYAHSLNENFIEKVTAGKAREFRPESALATLDAEGGLRLAEVSTDKFLTYASNNGWNNQLLNLLCAVDMARLLNRTLIVPPFAWPHRRGPAKVSVARLVDFRKLATLGVRLLAEDEAGTVSAALAAANVGVETIHGEGQPHRKRKQPRWSREAWQRRREDSTGVLSVTCCLFWTWALPHDIALEIYSAVHYHPALTYASAMAGGPSLGLRYAAMHVRRGDKAHVDSAYRDLFGGKMTPEFFLGLMVDEGLHKCKPPDCVVFVATDELNRTWFDPFREAGYALRFADDLKQPPLLDALSSFPQPLWPDVLAILEQIVCIHATEGFVGSLPSTLSGHVINARHAAAAALGGASAASGRHNGRPLFTKLHESCCDERTAVDLLRLPGVTTLADVPCEPHEGNPWC